MSLKKILANLPSDAPHMVGDGFRVHTFFPSEKISMKRMSPFLLMDYNAPVEFLPREEPRGVGVHPHRGFETVTIAYQGSVAHHDSAGHAGVISEGEVQWMTAGSGILHKEYHEQGFSRRGGIFHMVQIWVNLPKAFKGTDPKYQSITREDYGVAILPNDAGEVEVIAGEFNGVKGPARTYSPMTLMNIRMKKGFSYHFAMPEEWNTAALMVSGEARLNGMVAGKDSLTVFENDGTDIEINAAEDVTILILCGQPIDEPIAAYGPFVMNRHEELEEAYRDFNLGKYGYLE